MYDNNNHKPGYQIVEESVKQRDLEEAIESRKWHEATLMGNAEEIADAQILLEDLIATRRELLSETLGHDSMVSRAEKAITKLK